MEQDEYDQLQAAMAASLGAENAGGNAGGQNNYVFSSDEDDDEG